MNLRLRVFFLTAVMFTAMATSAILSAAANPSQPAQAQAESSQSAQTPMPVIKAETRLVLVDTIVTDKKGSYLHDLTAKDFKVYEDNKEQAIKSFSMETGTAASQDPRPRYLVLFFDNSTMGVSDQVQARQAATKFVESNAGSDRYIAVVEFGGTVRIAQNFTADAKLLQKAVKNLNFSAVSPNAEPVQVASLGMPSLYNSQADFGARTLLLALRSVARNMASVPGRKSLVLLTAGFPMDPGDPTTPERQSELTAVINACNRANVSIYPIDVRGLNAATPSPIKFQERKNSGPRLLSAVLKQSDDEAEDSPATLVYVQKGGSGGGGGHVGGGSGGHTGGTGGTGGKPGGAGGSSGSRGGAVGYNPYFNNYYNQSHQIVPAFPPLASTNQQVLYQLAEGTGGFVIVNTNDLLGGMQKISHDQGEYYVLGYTPPTSEEGSCHSLKVKVERSGTVVRSRSGYCDVKSTDMLAGKPAEKQLENRVGASQAGTVAATMRAPYFYVSPNIARVNLAMEIPPSAFKVEKEKGKLRSSMNVLGLACKPDGTVAARFSDTVNLDFDDKKEVEEFNKKPFRYQNEFDVAAGTYQLKVVFSSGGDAFGKLEAPLVVDAYNGKQFSMSAVALSKDLHPLAQMSSNLEAQLLEDHTPLVAQGLQIIPSGSDTFKKTDLAILYVEIYDPLLAGEKPPKVGVQYRVVDRKTGEKKVDVTGAANEVKAGNPVVPVGLKIPVDTLPPGSYRIELMAMDTAGNSSPHRTADFEVQ